MIKIKTSNVVLITAAVAALIFLLPSDKDASTVGFQKPQASNPLKGDTTKTYQQQMLEDVYLHSA